jgi:hypothetical protein
MYEMKTTVVKVPGAFRNVYLDIETEKLLKPVRRWKVTTVGVAAGSSITVIDGDDELAVLAAVACAIPEGSVVRYAATREFDEMVLRGRFTNARRAHLAKPTYPAMPGAEQITWLNLKPGYGTRNRMDVPGREIPAARNDGRWPKAMAHNLRDVAELILRDGTPDGVCCAWCYKVLNHATFAANFFHW